MATKIIDNTIRISVNLGVGGYNIAERLERIADAQGITVNKAIRHAIEEFLQKYEPKEVQNAK